MSDTLIIMGLYKYIRDGVFNPVRYKKTIEEIKMFLNINRYFIEKNNVIVLAGDSQSEKILKSLNLKVHWVFNELPAIIQNNKAHLMKHYMVAWALKKYKKDVLWVDWDNVVIKSTDDDFWKKCKKYGTPKFIYIPNYWAVVNCGVYYAPYSWLHCIEDSFSLAEVKSIRNDELLWAYCLPEDVQVKKEYWLGNMALNIWTLSEIKNITAETYFAHVRSLNFYSHIIEYLKDKGIVGGDNSE